MSASPAKVSASGVNPRRSQVQMAARMVWPSAPSDLALEDSDARVMADIDVQEVGREAPHRVDLDDAREQG